MFFPLLRLLLCFARWPWFTFFCLFVYTIHLTWPHTRFYIKTHTYTGDIEIERDLVCRSVKSVKLSSKGHARAVYSLSCTKSISSTRLRPSHAECCLNKWSEFLSACASFSFATLNFDQHQQQTAFVKRSIQTSFYHCQHIKSISLGHLFFPHAGNICSSCLSALLDPRTLRYEETVIIALATVSVLAVVAVAAFFGYRMMHGELPWRPAARESREHLLFKVFEMFSTKQQLIFLFINQRSTAFFMKLWAHRRYMFCDF